MNNKEKDNISINDYFSNVMLVFLALGLDLVVSIGIYNLIKRRDIIMFGIINYGVFMISVLALNLTPGADTMYILGNSMSRGKKVGVMSALGINTGCIIHTILAALGLSAILAKSAYAFSIIKYLGASYLIYLGIRSLISKSSILMKKDKDKKDTLKKVYFQGIITNVLNPKVVLFFLGLNLLRAKLGN